MINKATNACWRFVKVIFFYVLVVNNSIAQTYSAISADACETLNITLSATPTSYDPHAINFTPNINLRMHTHEALFQLELNNDVTPVLAKSWSNPSENVWIIELRDDAKFHDGSGFSVKDVIYSFDRILQSKSVNAQNEYLKSIDSYEAIDDFTLKIKTKYPTPLLPNYLTYIFIIKHDAALAAEDNPVIEDADNPKIMNGTGIYKFKDVKTRSHNNIKLVINPEHRAFDQNQFRNINIISFPDREIALNGMLDGKIDVLLSVLPNDLKKLRLNSEVGFIDALSIRLMLLHMDTYRDQSPFITSHDDQPLKSNPFKDKRVRSAISHAIDRQAILDRVLSGAGSVADQLVPEILSTSTPNITPIEYDVSHAKSLLSDAGYPNGFKVTLHGPNNRYINDKEVMEEIAQMLQAINIEVTVNDMPKKAYFQQLVDHEFSFMFFGWTPDDGQVSNTLESLLMSYDPENNQGLFNTGRYINPRLDDVIKRAIRTTSPATRLQLLRHATQLVLDDHAIIPLYFQPKIIAYNKEKVTAENPNWLAINSAEFFQCAASQ